MSWAGILHKCPTLVWGGLIMALHNTLRVATSKNKQLSGMVFSLQAYDVDSLIIIYYNIYYARHVN